MNIAKSAILLLSLYPTFLVAQNLQCPDIARTLKTYQIDTSSNSFLNSVFSQNCQQDGSKKSSGGGIGLEAIIKAVPIKFSGNYSSAEEGFTNFCKSYSSLATSTSSQDVYREYISDKALVTIEQCNKLQANGVQITHEIVNTESVAFYLRNSVNQIFEIQGISTTGSLTCNGLVKGKTVKFNISTSIPVTATQGFSCLRQGVASTKGKIFDEASVTILTNQGNYSVLLPRDERLSENLASAIASQINALRSDLATSTTLLHVVTDARAVPIYQCPVGWIAGSPPGQWASYACQGQISSLPRCTDVVYNKQALTNVMTCTPLGSIRPY